MAITETFSVEGLVSVERGEVDRRIFSDQEIFDAEMELIFGRAWQFLCHESQIPKAGDFFETPMGLDNVLAVRQKDGTIKGLLNTCAPRKRGVPRRRGQHQGLHVHVPRVVVRPRRQPHRRPGIDRFYKGDLDMTQHGLGRSRRSRATTASSSRPWTQPRLRSRTTSADRAPGHRSHRDAWEHEVIPGIQKFIIDCNWKFAVDNLFDWYHPQVTHMSAMASGIIPPSPDVVVDVGCAKTTQGDDLPIPAGLGGSGIDEMTFVAEYGHAIGGPSAKGLGDAGGLIDHS